MDEVIYLSHLIAIWLLEDDHVVVLVHSLDGVSQVSMDSSLNPHIIHCFRELLTRWEQNWSRREEVSLILDSILVPFSLTNVHDLLRSSSTLNWLGRVDEHSLTTFELPTLLQSLIGVLKIVD